MFPHEIRLVLTVPIDDRLRNDQWRESLQWLHSPSCRQALRLPVVPDQHLIWYFQSRNANPERQLTVWLNGGSGSSSLSGPFEENGGPCRVNNDSETTTLNPWSWNEHSDMLYIDQPNQFGFSYDTLVNSSLTMTANGQHIDSLEGVQPVPEMNATFYTGKLPSQVVENTANTTAIAAETMWHLLQGWTEGFPHHRRRRGDKLSIWSESVCAPTTP